MPNTEFALPYVVPYSHDMGKRYPWQETPPSDEGLPALLHPMNITLENLDAPEAREVEAGRGEYVQPFLDGQREFPRKTVLRFLHSDQTGTFIPSLVGKIYDGISSVANLQECKGHIGTYGGEARRLTMPVEPTQESFVPHVIRQCSQRLLDIPKAGQADDSYEQQGRRVLAAMTHPYNADVKVPVPQEALSHVYTAVVASALDALEQLPKDPRDDMTVKQQGKETIIRIPASKYVWQPPRIDCLLSGGVGSLSPYNGVRVHAVFSPNPDDIEGYVLRIAQRPPPENTRWASISVLGGVIDRLGNMLHHNIEMNISPLATEENEYGPVDMRSGPLVSARQNVGVSLAPGQTVYIPDTPYVGLHQPNRNAFPDLLPLDMQRLLTLWSRELSYYALMHPWGDVPAITTTMDNLCESILETTMMDQHLPPAKQDELLRNLALAYLLAPNNTHTLMSESRGYVLFPRLKWIGSGKIASLDLTDYACYPTEFDLLKGRMNWSNEQTGIENFVHHARTNCPVPKKMSPMAEFCWLFCPEP